MRTVLATASKVFQLHAFIELVVAIRIPQPVEAALTTVAAEIERTFVPEQEEEYEDDEGNVFNKKTYDDLKRQGLL